MKWFATSGARLWIDPKGLSVAFTSNDFRFIVRGTFDNGEVWFNRFAAQRTDGGADPQDVVDALNAMYSDIYSTSISSHTQAVGATYQQLSGPGAVEATWPVLTGDDLADLLPTECAIRLSLSTASGVRGGPFLAGWSVNAVDADGQLVDGIAGDVVGFYAAFYASAVAADWIPAIERPTASTLNLINRARVGETFDVIRKRRNALAEAYEVIALP